jgi:hypothetical protein
MKDFLLTGAVVMVGVGAFAFGMALFARGIALTLQHYGLNEEWACVVFGVGVFLAGAACLSLNPLISGIK